MDVGIVYQGYASDVTRTCFFHEGSKELVDLRTKVMSLQRQILDLIKPGVKLKDLAIFAKHAIESMGPYTMVHSLGHGLGLEVHECPRLSVKAEPEDILKPGMVITIEPGVYIEGVGGFREEDTVVVTENVFKNFYKNFEFATVKV
jgi:Xaa-Pro aminopeptidase